MRPNNLTKRAARELVAVIDRSERLFGAEHADRFEEDILTKCREIELGFNHGHVRTDVTFKAPTRFINVGVVVIIYRPHTRQVISIVDGRRDFGRLFR